MDPHHAASRRSDWRARARSDGGDGDDACDGYEAAVAVVKMLTVVAGSVAGAHIKSKLIRPQGATDTMQGLHNPSKSHEFVDCIDRKKRAVFRDALNRG